MEDLNFEAQYIRVSLTNDGDGNPICTIKLDDDQELNITAFELEGLKDIIYKHYVEMHSYCNKVMSEGYGIQDYCSKCGEPIEENRLRQDKDENILCEDCFTSYLVENHTK